MAVPALVAVAGLLMWGLLAVAAQIRCVDAARAGARAAARSDAPGEVLRITLAAAPKGAAVRVWSSAGMVRVRVTVPRPRFPVTLTAEAAALDEATLEAGVPGGAVVPEADAPSGSAAAPFAAWTAHAGRRSSAGSVRTAGSGAGAGRET
ncbi:TadE family type IV pilus minor pilin [Actinacidiphila yeochonensis]|uniref:TadE family type IV pilus minor pilin n=1 Tax=Actinacidiphila yeochonensis TaxID=89050 RepID=UPI0018E36140|nr:TadE family type IV pilus minor pilin [Actinacidiphila yeochonensis]